MPERILVTSALPYANGPIHLGHLAGAYLPADIFVRYHRLKGSDVVFICGSDEHGVPIMIKARNENLTPQEIVNRFHEMNKISFEAFGISFDYYGRTSSEIHHRTSQDFFRKLAEKDEFILKTEEQLYDPEAGMFLADRFVRGTCPICGYEDAYGDQCESCGSSLSPKELIKPRSAITAAQPIAKQTTHWYLPLADHQKRLESWIAEHPDWKSNVLGQVQSWFNDGLKDRAVTRDLPWGVAIPEDVAKNYQIDATGKVLYVWFDAPIGYISATKEWAISKGNENLWQDYWLNNETRLVHFIGKDNIVFHCLIFPAMLMAHGEFILPDNVPANEFLNLEGNKLSTSRNYAVWLDEYLQKFEADSLRYALASNLPETKDADFSWKDFQARHNNELADILGNFINRTVTFTHKYYGGAVPAKGRIEPIDQQLIDQLKTAPVNLGNLIDKYQIRNYVRDLMDVVRFANKYFNDKEPWTTRKQAPESCATTINLCLQMVCSLAILAEPVIPFSVQKIRKMLNFLNPSSWSDAGNLNLQDDHRLDPAEILFSKIEDDKIEIEIGRLQSAVSGTALKKSIAAEQSELISIENFSKVDLRVAKIIQAKKVAKSDRLLKLLIDLGDSKRQIVAGIAQSYEPDKLLGKKVIVVVNLVPAILRGIKSEGMLLAASSDKKLCLLTVDDDVPAGSKIS